MMSRTINKMGVEEWFFASICVLAFLIPISQFAATRWLVATILFSFTVRRSTPFDSYLKQGWDLWAFVAILTIGLAYTDNMDAGLSVLETSLSLGVFPIVFLKVLPLGKDRLYFICYSFGAGLLVALLFCFGQSLWSYSMFGDSAVFYGNNLTSFLENTHPTYFAYYTIFTITFGLYLLYYDEGHLSPAVLIALLMFLFAMLLLLGTTAIVAILFSLLYFILKFTFEGKRLASYRAAFFCSVFFLLFLVTVNSFEIIGYSTQSENDYWERYALWESALKAMPNWVIGVGTGDYMSVLLHYYSSHGQHDFATSNLNAHNQYIEVLFSVGIAGIGAFILMVGRPIYWAIRTQNILGFLTFFPFLIYGMTEVFLGRFQGVIFFALLHQTFISFYLRQEVAVLNEDRI
jgi:hypothetical protein